MTAEELGRCLRDLEERIDSLPGTITDTRLLVELAEEYRQLAEAQKTAERGRSYG